MYDQHPTPIRLFAALPATVAARARSRPARTGLQALADAAVTADRAGLDALVVRRGDPADPATVEPAGVLAVVAARTVALGLVAEASPAYYEPFHLARELATLDILSAGRAGLLLDPRANPAEQWAGLAPHEEAAGDGGTGAGHARAEEYLTVLTGLWDSFDDDAFLHDRASGRYFRPEALHPLDHHGTHYRVAGPLNIARPPQGHPVLLTAWTPSAGTHADYHVAAEDGGTRVPRLTPVTLPATGSAAAEENADLLEKTIRAEQPHGLLLDLPAGPASLEVFARLTLPLLRERGLLPPPADRKAHTLRRRLGLARPVDRATAAGGPR